MKKFYQCSSFFAILSSVVVFVLKMITFIESAINYSNADNGVSQSLYSATMQESLITGLFILMIGLAIGSIISLLIKISDKKDIEDEE